MATNQANYRLHKMMRVCLFAFMLSAAAPNE